MLSRRQNNADGLQAPTRIECRAGRLFYIVSTVRGMPTTTA